MWQEMQKGYHQSRPKRTMTNMLSAVFCSDFRCKAVSYQIAARGWEKLQFHSYHPGSVAPGLSDGGG